MELYLQYPGFVSLWFVAQMSARNIFALGIKHVMDSERLLLHSQVTATGLRGIATEYTVAYILMHFILVFMAQANWSDLWQALLMKCSYFRGLCSRACIPPFAFRQ
jgi:phosphatidylglycerophosphate synthase